MLGGVFLAPSFVWAGDICYVDKDAEGSGDGSGGKPYKKISKAIEDDKCKEVKVSNGTYSESLVLKKSQKLNGSNRDKTVIEGKLIMQNNSEIGKVTVYGGIEIEEGADAEIDNAEVKKANIGILTSGGGKLVINDTVITDNRKGLYIQKGKNIKITNCKIYKNAEEGLDIRADVSGSINNNQIYENGESGIEVILGKSELDILNNDINRNDSSGIAAQFYTDTDNLGNVHIKNNIISKNSNYGLDCKAPSGGEGKPKGYWSDSMELNSNKVFENKKKDFATACKFDEDKIADATKTKEEREAELAALEEKERQEALSVLEKEKKLQLEAQKAEEERIAKIDAEEKAIIDNLSKEVEAMLTDGKNLEEKIKNRSAWTKFFIGEDYKTVIILEENLTGYGEKIELMEDRKNNIADENILSEVNEQILNLKEKREDLVNFLDSREERFSLLGWFLRRFNL